MSDAVRVQGLAQVALTVTDLEAVRAFYRDALGLQHLFDAGTMAFFDCGGVRLLVGTGEAKPGGGTLVYFRVADLEGAIAALKGRGAEIVQDAHLVAPMKSYDVWLAFVRDPAGNVLGLMEEKQRVAGSV
ncbi:MAG TPA: VOC family protein [Acidobacteriaceae bacterium]|nr:VOC family protein [Acidobacteriaceae bacterium]